MNDLVLFTQELQNIAKLGFQTATAILKSYSDLEKGIEMSLSRIDKVTKNLFSNISDAVKTASTELINLLAVKPNEPKELLQGIENLDVKLKELQKNTGIKINIKATGNINSEIGAIGKQVDLVKNVEQVKDKSGKGDALGKIGSFAFPVASTIAKAVYDPLSIVGSDNKERIQKANPQLVAGIEKKTNQISDNIGNGMASAATSVLPLINMIQTLGVEITAMIPQVVSAIQPLIDILNSLPINVIIQDTKNFVGILLKSLTPVLAALKPTISTIFISGFALIHNVFGAFGRILTALAPIITMIAKVLNWVLKPVLDGLFKILNGVIKAVSWLINKIGSVVSAVGSFFSSSNKNDTVQKTATIANENNAISFQGNASGMQNVLKTNNNTAETRDVFTSLNSLGNTKAITAPSTDTPKASNKPDKIFADNSPRSNSNNSVEQRRITININKSFVENFTINAKEVKEGYDNLKLRVEEIFLEILNSANAVGA